VRADDWGHALEWPKDLDMGADRLYELSREQAGLPTASQFDKWMAQHRLSLSFLCRDAGVFGILRS
jgi:hypothetical protein